MELALLSSRTTTVRHSVTSPTLNWQIDQKKLLITFIAIGVICSTASYYKENIYLFSGGLCISLFPLEYQKSISIFDSILRIEFDNESLLLTSIITLIRSVAFMIFSFYIGISIRESWSKSFNSPDTIGTNNLAELLLRECAFYQVQKCVYYEIGPRIGEKIPHLITINCREKSIVITAIALLSISAMITFAAPNLNTLIGIAFISILKGIVIGVAAEKSDTYEFLHLFKISTLLVSLIFIGSKIGQTLHAKLGLKNFRPSHHWSPYLILLCDLREWITFSLFFGVLLFKEKIQPFFIWSYQHFSFLQEYDPDKILMNLKTFLKSPQELNGKNSKSLKKLIHNERLRKLSPSDNVIIHFIEFIAYLAENKNQSITQSLNHAETLFKEFYALYQSHKKGIIIDLNPLKFDRSSSKEDVKRILSQRIELIKRLSEDDSFCWTKKHAAYILCAPFDSKDPDNTEHKNHQKENYRQLLVWFHPDKTSMPEDLLVYLTRANTILIS